VLRSFESGLNLLAHFNCEVTYHSSFLRSNRLFHKRYGSVCCPFYNRDKVPVLPGSNVEALSEVVLEVQSAYIYDNMLIGSRPMVVHDASKVARPRPIESWVDDYFFVFVPAENRALVPVEALGWSTNRSCGTTHLAGQITKFIDSAVISSITGMLEA
jgi:hypothetical protein